MGRGRRGASSRGISYSVPGPFGGMLARRGYDHVSPFESRGETGERGRWSSSGAVRLEMMCESFDGGGWGRSGGCCCWWDWYMVWRALLWMVGFDRSAVGPIAGWGIVKDGCVG